MWILSARARPAPRFMPSHLSQPVTFPSSSATASMPPLPDARDPIWKELVDVHSHAQHAYTLYSSPECFGASSVVEPNETTTTVRQASDALTRVRTSRVFVYGTRPNDWLAAKMFKEAGKEKVVAGYALHPWFVESVDEVGGLQAMEDRKDVVSALKRTGWGRVLLEEYLEPAMERGEPVVLAEFGMDRAATKPGTPRALYDWEVQQRLFRIQLLLGAELGLPVSIHCVRAWGQLFETLSLMSPDDLPPRMMLHSFSGKSEVLKQLLTKLPKETSSRLYFSLSPLNLRAGGAPSFLQGLPADRLLLESDVHAPDQIDGAMWRVCSEVARGLGWTVEECARRTGENARRWLGTRVELG